MSEPPLKKTKTEQDDTATDTSKRSVFWKDDHVVLIDQRRLPHTFLHHGCKTVAEVAESITSMTVRGAPAIGATGAYGMALAAKEKGDCSVADLVAHLVSAKGVLDDARPTAVNLSWATGRMLHVAQELAEKKGMTVTQMQNVLLEEAEELANDDVRINQSLGKHGAAVIKENANIIHHCNTGRLATVDYGTALGVIYTLHEQGKKPHVWVDETRPRLQGARLTAFELHQSGVDLHVIVDSASGHLMRNNKVDVVVFGADRVAANGDVANKIGSYNLSVVACENKVPVYACVPTPTIDLEVATGDDIVIEERSDHEITHIGHSHVCPNGVQVFNPAFDVTPAKYLTGIVTEEGICYPPFSKTLKEAKLKAEARMEVTWKARLEKYLS